jgi:hypothetical protein
MPGRQRRDGRAPVHSAREGGIGPRRDPRGPCENSIGMFTHALASQPAAYGGRGPSAALLNTVEALFHVEHRGYSMLSEAQGGFVSQHSSFLAVNRRLQAKKSPGTGVWPEPGVWKGPLWTPGSLARTKAAKKKGQGRCPRRPHLPVRRLRSASSWIRRPACSGFAFSRPVRRSMVAATACRQTGSGHGPRFGQDREPLTGRKSMPILARSRRGYRSRRRFNDLEVIMQVILEGCPCKGAIPRRPMPTQPIPPAPKR